MIGNMVAQTNSLNVMKTVVFNNLTYQLPEPKKGVGAVLGTVASALITKQITEQQTGYREALRAAIVKGVSQGHRIKLMDGTGMDQADWYVDATVTNISTTQKVETYKDKDGKDQTKTYYKAHVGVTLHVKSVETNQVLASPMFSLSDYDCSWIETTEGALNNAFHTLADRITTYFDRWMPLHANIVEGARDKKDKQKEVYIDLGNYTKGMYTGLRFGVYTTKMVAGKEARKQIGRLKVIDIEGGEISLCKVQSGGKDIKAALDAGTPLLVISNE